MTKKSPLHPKEEVKKADSTEKKLPKKKMKFTNRKLDQGMGVAVARRTYLRKIVDQDTGRERWEKWEEVADRVAKGNSMLVKNIKGIGKKHQEEEYEIDQFCKALLAKKFVPEK